MTNNGMLVCSFNLKARFSQSDKELYSLNHPYEFESNDGETPIIIENAAELFRLFCETNSTLSDDEKKKKVFAIKENSYRHNEKDTYTALSFVIRSGSYGVEADITDKNTQEVKYHRNEDEPDVKEFLCVVYIPKDVGNLQIKRGILVFQSIGTYGVKTITADKMRAFFSNFKLTFETRSVSISAFIEKLVKQGSLHKLTLIRNSLSLNPSDNMLISTGREEKSYIHPNLYPEWLSKMLSIFQKADETGIIEIPDSEDFDDISFQFKLGDSIRTVRLRNLEKLSIVEDIPDSVVQGKNDEKIIKYMINTANAYKERMVWGAKSEV